MKQSWWDNVFFYQVRGLFSHYIRRTCTCHKWPWETWAAKSSRAAMKEMRESLRN